jgi:LysR family transcriptional regulator, hca operon transcriptional activator
MDLRYLRYFIAVAEELSFTHAAEHLHTAQPSLSQQIRRLEDEILGTPLFRRDKHHVELTEAGRVFLPEAKSLLASMEKAISMARQAARSASGHISIGFIEGAEGAVLSQVLPALQELYPHIEVSVRNLRSSAQLTALHNRQIDVGFLRGPCEGSDLCWTLVLSEPVMAAVPAQHELARLERIPIALLATLPLISVSLEGSAVVHELPSRIAAQSGVRFRPGPETDGVLSTLHTIGAGLGFSFLPSYVQRIRPPTVEVRPLAMDRPPEIELFAVYRRDDRNLGLESFLKLLRQNVCPSGVVDSS